MGFSAIAISFAMRSCLSVAITEMVIPVNSTGTQNNSLICPVDPVAVEERHHLRTVSHIARIC